MHPRGTRFLQQDCNRFHDSFSSIVSRWPTKVSRRSSAKPEEANSLCPSDMIFCAADRHAFSPVQEVGSGKCRGDQTGKALSCGRKR